MRTMIQTATADMLPGLKQLWQTCFDDTAAGTDFVFSNLLHPERILVQADAGQPIAMLCWHPLTFTTPSAAFNGAYIFGVGTAPEHRGNGISTALLEKAEDALRGQGVRLSCLVPASESLFDFYAGRGYATQFNYRLLNVSAERIPATDWVGELTPDTVERFAESRDLSAFGGSSLYGSWDEDYMHYTVAECRFWGGELLRFTTFEGDNGGYAACYPDGKGGILVKEAFLLSEDDIDDLLATLHTYFGAKHYQLRLPTDFMLDDKWQAQTLPFAMTKWYYEEDAAAVATGSAPWFAFGLDG